MLLRHILLNHLKNHCRRHLLSTVLIFFCAVFSLLYFYLLPILIGEYYLPNLWESHGIGHLDCKVRRISFSRIELQDIYFWNDYNQEGAVNRGTLTFHFTPWGVDSLLELKSVSLFGLHASVSYLGGEIQIHGLNIKELCQFKKYFRVPAPGVRGSFQQIAVKNSHVDFFCAGRRLHLPFTMQCSFEPGKNIYQMIGYAAPRGEYCIISGQYFPRNSNLIFKLKNENINLGCFNDLLPEDFHKRNLVGRLSTIWSYNTGKNYLECMETEFMTGKPDRQFPNCSLGLLYKSTDGSTGNLNFQCKFRGKSGVYTASGKPLRIQLKYPYLNYEGIVYSELYPNEKILSSIQLPPRFAARNEIQGQFSLVNFKWEISASGNLEDGLTAIHPRYGRLGCSQAVYDASLSKKPGFPIQIQSSLSIPHIFLQNQNARWEFNGLKLKMGRHPGENLKFFILGDGLRFHSPRYRLQADSWKGEATAFTPSHDFQLQGDISNLKQQYQNHEILCSKLCYALHKHPDDSTVYLNVNSRQTSLQSSVHGYFTDCLQLNWNWLFNPSMNAMAPGVTNYLRCPCLHLPRQQTARLDMQFQQQNTTACWNGKIQVQSRQKEQTIEVSANMHWPQWRQLPFMALHADMPRHLLNDLPFLQELFPEYLYAPVQDDNSIISLWLDSIWFNGKLRTRTGYSLLPQSQQHSGLPSQPRSLHSFP